MEVLPSGELLNSTLNNEEVVTKVRKMSNTLLHEALHAAMVREARNRMVSDGANMDNLYVTFHIPTTIMLLLTEATLFFWNI
jgi:hypothetical protein